MSTSVTLNQGIEYDFENYVQGNTFAFFIDFFQDDKGLIPSDLTGSTFAMDILREDGGCCFGNRTKEILELGTGLFLSVPPGGTVLNRLNFSKILESTFGHYKQNVTWTDTAGKVFTFERGKLKIDQKV